MKIRLVIILFVGFFESFVFGQESRIYFKCGEAPADNIIKDFCNKPLKGIVEPELLNVKLACL